MATTQHHRPRGVRAAAALLGAVVLLLAGTAPATAAVGAQVAVTSYDILDTPISGFGGWGHTYTGTITPNGLFDPQGAARADYAHGSGTLNDGVDPTTIAQTHLFTTAGRGNPTITLHLAGPTFVDRIDVLGGSTTSDLFGSGFNGALTGATVQIGGSSAGLPGLEFGPLNAAGMPSNDHLDLASTPLAAIATDTIVLRDFTALSAGSADQFPIGEITVVGRPATTTIDISIFPGEPNETITAGSNTSIPVAILSSATFDATRIDTASLRFGRTGTEKSLKSCSRPKDANNDGRADLRCQFAARTAAFRPGDTAAVLRGATSDGRSFEGAGTVRVVR